MWWLNIATCVYMTQGCRSRSGWSGHGLITFLIDLLVKVVGTMCTLHAPTKPYSYYVVTISLLMTDLTTQNLPSCALIVHCAIVYNFWLVMSFMWVSWSIIIMIMSYGNMHKFAAY